MCGIAGIFHNLSQAAVDAEALGRVARRMAHRGPDGEGHWESPGVGLSHRRLAVVDATPAGAQPMLWLRDSAGRQVSATWEAARTLGSSFTTVAAIVYNGELYNDAELRAELAAAGVEFRSRSDTETVLAALATWGRQAVDRLRGMYVLAYADVSSGTLLVARDPLGIKPLYYTVVRSTSDEELIFASELSALIEHPRVARRPDHVTVSSYLTTIRTTLGSRTLYDGVSILEPGERLLVRRGGNGLAIDRSSWWDDTGSHERTRTHTHLAAAVTDSVRRHLRSDVPLCCLLSGGLDSSIVSYVGRHSWGQQGVMTTFCAGADAVSGGSDDFEMARLMAGVLGSRHIEARVTREMFRERWSSMVDRLCIPLSTPNEVAINEVARRLREEGFTVALSGEGADELFGGYDSVMRAASGHLAEHTGETWRSTGGLFHLNLAAWVPLDTKQAVLSPAMLNAAHGDDLLRAEYDRQFRLAASGLTEQEGLQAHLRFQRRVNLHGLLLRLDQATMLESVEGRTPLADQEIAALAEHLPVERKFSQGPQPGSPARTKIALREAFADVLPPAIVHRPKASFPLPFETWMSDLSSMLADSPAGREWFTPEAVAFVTADPNRAWKFAWPMVNLARWSRKF